MYDISRSLTSRVAVWPGDQPFEHEWSLRLEDGASVNLSAIRLSTHAGTHLDAPLHFQQDGASVDQIPLLQLIGTCFVIDLREATAIRPEHVSWNVGGKYRRILFKTRHSSVPDEAWDPALAAVLPDTIDALGEQGVVLIGTDAPSVDPVDSSALDAHQALARNGIVNLENLTLAGVPEGAYVLIALPLNLPGLDAAPVRALLFRPDEIESAMLI